MLHIAGMIVLIFLCRPWICLQCLSTVLLRPIAQHVRIAEDPRKRRYKRLGSALLRRERYNRDALAAATGIGLVRVFEGEF